MLIGASHSPWQEPGVYMAVITGLGLIGAAAAALVRLGIWIGGTNKHMTAVEKHVEGAQKHMSAVEKHMAGTEKHMSAVERFMREIRRDLRKLLYRFGASASDGSPLRLTDLGRKISDTVDAPAWARETAKILRLRVEGKPPYEVQDACFSFVDDEFEPSDEFHATMRMCAYELGIDDIEVLTVLAITLRDELLTPSPTEAQANDQPQTSFAEG